MTFKKYTKKTADILPLCGALPKSRQSALPAKQLSIVLPTLNTILPVLQNLSILGHFSPQGSNPIEIQLKPLSGTGSRESEVRKIQKNARVSNTLALVFCIVLVSVSSFLDPDCAPSNLDVTNHQQQLTAGKLNKKLKAITSLNKIITGLDF